MKTYNQLELVHTNTESYRFRAIDDWISLEHGYPSPGDYCIAAYMAGDNNATHYCVAQYTIGGFEEFNTDAVIPNHNLLGWKYLGELPY